MGLGKFISGMDIKIPARFQDQNKNAVEMENAVVGIEYFDKNHNDLLHVLKDTTMKKVASGQYSYEYRVPPNAGLGNYIVRIHAKQPGNRSDIIEATDFFEVVDSLPTTPDPVSATEVNGVAISRDGEDSFEREKNDLIEQMRNSRERKELERGAQRNYIEDIVVDHLNEPVSGVHVNVYEKMNFVPKSTNNVLVASDMTGPDGRWRMTLPRGEYVFVYKGIGKRENREFRKII